MTRKIKALAAVIGFAAAGVILSEITVKALCYFLLFIFNL